MGDSKFVCPLCCGGTFNSRQSLADHLVSYTENFRCVVCQQKFNSLENLTIHLNDQCYPNDTREKSNENNNISLKIEVSSGNQNILVVNGTSMNENINGDEGNEIDGTNSKVNTENIIKEPLEDNKRVVDMELTGKHSGVLEDSIVTCLESEQFKFIDEHGENKYILLGNDGTSTLISDSTIITKQNNDGTISLLSIKNEEKPSDVRSSTTKKELENDATEEFYNCTSCGVTFTSVLEHIQTYHSNQEVVLEMNGSDGRTEDVADDETITLEFPPELDHRNNLQSDNIRRVITESGDIVTNYAGVEMNEDLSHVKDPVHELIDAIILQHSLLRSQQTGLIAASMFAAAFIKADELLKNNPSHTLIEQEVVDEIGQVYTRKLVKIDRFWGNVNLEEKSEINDSVHVKEDLIPVHHHAVIKKIKLADGSWSSEMYNCVKCNAFTSTVEEFKKHVCELKYPCPHCPVAYSNSKSLCAHMKVHKTAKQVSPKSTLQTTNGTHKPGANESPNGPFRCEVCSTVFPTNKSLRLHRRMHDPIKSRPLEPPVEQGRCNNMDPNETFHCLQCNKWIPVGYKKVHLNYHRSSNTTYNCGICNRKFNSDDFLAMHMKIHNIDRGSSVKQGKSLPYSCVYCSRQFARPHEKVKHERIHTGEKPHACEICGKSFRVSYCLTLHMRTHTGMRPYACPHCGKRFKAHSVYNHHLLTHSEVRAYKCPYCPKAFKTSVQLAGHKNSHTKPYSCTHCNRPFASLYAVRVHTDSHRRTNNLKFSCSLCGASYARTFALKDHMKQAHQSEIDPDDNIDTGDKDWVDPSLEGIILDDINNEVNETKEMTVSSNEADSEMIIGLVPSIENKS